MLKIKKTKVKRKITVRDGKFYTPRGVELTRNSHTMTEAEYFAMILSALRNTTRWWKPAAAVLNSGKRNSQSENKKLKWEYRCASCLGWFSKKLIQIDHVIPCGGINGYDKIIGWLLKAHIESEEGFQLLCKPCHKIKTKQEKSGGI